MKVVRKNKDIEVRIEETKKNISGKTYEVTELYIGKKKIGEVLAFGPKEFQSFMDNEEIGASKTLDLAIESIIRQWNLHE